MRDPNSTSSLRVARAFYFFFYGAMGCYLPFINLYLNAAGLSGAAIGILSSLPPLVLLISGPLWGAIGDHFRIHRRLLPLATFGSIIPVLLIPRSDQFPLLALLIAWAAFFSLPVSPLIDSAVLELVNGTRTSYGHIRVWGSLGFVVASPITGYLIESLGLGSLFYANASLMLVAGVLSLSLPARRESLQTSFLAGVRQLLRQRALVLYLAGVFLIGATLQASYAFFPLYLESLGGGSSAVGLSSALSAVSELPVVFFSGGILAWLGVRNAVIASYLFFVARWGALALLRAPALVMATNVLHGITFGPYLVGGVAYVQQHTPPGLHATSQALLMVTGFGLGAAAGALGGGWLYDLVGPAGLFAVSAVIALVAAGFVILAGEGRRAVIGNL